MSTYINRETLRNDLLGYATCMYRPTMMTRDKVLAVVDTIPGKNIVHCDECVHAMDCEIVSLLGENGYCSNGEVYADA